MHKAFLVACALGILTTIFLWSNNIERTKPRVVFCDVGQGDGIYIRSSDEKDLVIDTGPNKLILKCLDNEMPYFDRSIEVLFLTHAQKDHAGGLIGVLHNFTVSAVYTPPDFKYGPDTQYRRIIQSENIPWEVVTQGDTLNFAQNQITVLWPPEINDQKTNSRDAVNNRALGLQVQFVDKEVLLLSDIDSTEGERALSYSPHHQSILKINHHGSQYGTSKRFLQLADPKMAVISAGKNNLYHHPHPTVLSLLKALGIPYKRTDVDGAITIVF